MTHESQPSNPSATHNATAAKSATVTLEQRNAALDRAKALILQGWTQGALARNDAGEDIVYSDPFNLNKGVCWCASGAVYLAERQINGPAWHALRTVVRNLSEFDMPAEYNDAPGRTKYEVAALFDHAKEMPL